MSQLNFKNVAINIKYKHEQKTSQTSSNHRLYKKQ
jgi:hypothetical protein